MRRVAFAGILAMKPQMLVLDEPSTGLDPAARKDFMQLIKKLNESGISIVMVSHNMDDLSYLCSRIIVLSQGQILMDDTPENIFANKSVLEQAHLDVPVAAKIAQNLIAKGFNLEEKLYSNQSLANHIAQLYKVRGV